MVEFLVDAIASFIGGCYSQKVTERKITVRNFFFSVFFTLVMVSLFSQVLSDGITFDETIFGLLLSFAGAFVCSVILIVWFKIKNIKRNKNH